MAQVSFFPTIIRLSPRTSRLTFQKMDFNLLDMMVYVIFAHLANYNIILAYLYYVYTYAYIWKEITKVQHMLHIFSRQMMIGIIQTKETNPNCQLPNWDMAWSLKLKYFFFGWKKNDHFFKNTKIKSKQEY